MKPHFNLSNVLLISQYKAVKVSNQLLTQEVQTIGHIIIDDTAAQVIAINVYLVISSKL